MEYMEAQMQQLYDGTIGSTGYDWVSPGRNRTPEEWPYSFDAYYVWREGGLFGAHAVYSDRMWEWDRKKAEKAFAGKQMLGPLDRSAAQDVIRRYYGGKCVCVCGIRIFM